MTRAIACMLLSLMLMPVPQVAAAQEPSASRPQEGSQQEARVGDQQAASAVDASRLGVSLSRIRRELAQAQAQAEETQGDEALRLRFTVEVVGTAPKIDLLEGFAVEGPVPYGPPTHQEVLDVLTPQEFRSPVVPFYGLAVMAAQKLFQFNQKKQCEAELAEYRRLVMQGVAIAAPRCTR